VLVDGRPRCELKLHSRNGSQLPAERSELPPIRFHDLRHTAASLTYRVTRDLKLVSELLGHSTIKITGDIYTSVFAEVDRAAAEAVAALVPRRRAHIVRTSGVDANSRAAAVDETADETGWS
jgi:integrase